MSGQRKPLPRIKLGERVVDLETGLDARYGDGSLVILYPADEGGTRIDPPYGEGAWKLICQDAVDLDENPDPTQSVYERHGLRSL